MLDMKLLREAPESVRAALALRGSDLDLEAVLAVDAEWRRLTHEWEQLRAEQNRAGDEIARLKREKMDAAAAIAAMKEVSSRIKSLDDARSEAEARLNGLVMTIPNIPHESVPHGHDEKANRLERKWGEPTRFDFEPKDHVALGEGLGILDFERAAKIAGARFSLSKGPAARLERALISFMLDVHTTRHGYAEVLPPFLVNSDSMRGTGQLPKFAADLFKLEGTDYWLIPTAEVPVTNIYRDEILEEAVLPVCFAAYTPCFRSEAGAYGKDTRGMVRQHQFNKVELVKFTKPEHSWNELEKLTRDAERILQLLDLPYQVVCLSTGDLGFSAAKTFDIEVWLPGQDCYREISSCSNFTDFQARRANIRFRRAGQKPEYVHTLNGSGLAVGRTVIAILENYQQADGSVRIPEALRSYMNGLEVIKAQS
ncbi:MAG: serine--tRNA ligase [Candidatus Hydrogenedentes bacterium]|nr:serine--tRNA ligase [Candidatus Hydrogenedentota bacterium]